MHVKSFESTTPLMDESTFIHETAVVIGDVELGVDVSIWPLAVVRGDIHRIKIGSRSNIQDGSVVHVTHASDFNPGTSPLCSLQLMMNMACTLFNFTPEQALTGVTAHAARALGFTDRGVLKVGARGIRDRAFEVSAYLYIANIPCVTRICHSVWRER